MDLLTFLIIAAVLVVTLAIAFTLMRSRQRSGSVLAAPERTVHDASQDERS